jgi:hypothetical protein
MLQRIRESIESKVLVLMYSGSTADTEVILVTMGGDGSLGCFIDDISTDHYIA